ncbi:LL-diaminopimelate aminotransferase [Treponema brennaborense]|uniref:LL-diaminopimelate aminotransferase n=1 Tax=Treponema brennaborense (strain DSM 12168 / CIP 105900 / DD5/3) TaxID=906968 RepID=F4LIF5_TREBD|nr:LL-diaminopimelate aminotransferase [Treponema brennaborense]AEE16196.1 LL-diaminopimelate aminotransferase [Treponema brennaborense DSM 12168]
MIRKNPAFENLAAGYLFPEIAKRRRSYAAAHPDAKLISLGIGNTTEPLTPYITAAMKSYVEALGTAAGYSGYGDDSAGEAPLRAKIASVLYGGLVGADEVFVSDGAKCDVGRVQQMFGAAVSVAVQDPAYPVYVDGSVMVGAAGKMPASAAGYADVTYMPCLPENNFFPDLSVVKPDSLIYFCSPNNPTGAVATKAELRRLVDFARANGCIILFDAAYFAFIRDPSLPKTIFEIDGARECAVEINSFSKPIGFTGVRLGWTVIPKELRFADGTPVQTLWTRLTNTFFNGASNIAQAGGLASLDPEGLAEMRTLTDYYLENARLIREALSGANFTAEGVETYAQGNAPYLWVRFPGRKSWEVFDAILDRCRVVTTPGAGFGPAGESFIRFSSFGHRSAVVEACDRLAQLKL